MVTGKREGSERIWARTLGVDRGEAKLCIFLPPIGMCGEKIG